MCYELTMSLTEREEEMKVVFTITKEEMMKLVSAGLPFGTVTDIETQGDPIKIFEVTVQDKGKEWEGK